MTSGAIVVLPASARKAIVAHARRAHPHECCGFLLGTRGRVTFVVPMVNVAASAVRFRIDERAHIELRRIVRTFSPTLAIVGVYHSHPAGPPVPSETDVAEAYYPEWVHVIVSLANARPRLAAFSIAHGCTTRLKMGR